MERNGFQSVIIAVMAGCFLFAGNPAYSAEQTPIKKEISPAAAAATAKTDKKEPAAAKTDKKEPAAAKASNKEAEAASEGVSIHLKAPFFSPLFTEVPLASVNDEKITVHDLQNALMSVHEKMTTEKETPAKQSFLETLQRLINVKLVVLEAKNIELDQLPEIKDDLDKNAEMQLRQVLFQERVKDLKPDGKEVDKVYREMIKEWKLKTVLFHKESDAKKFLEELKAGKTFEELREKALKAGIAEQAGQNEELYANKASLGPVLGEAMSDLKAGSVSPVISIMNAFAIVKVVDAKSIENPELKTRAENQVLSQMRLANLNKYKDELYRKYSKENTKLIKSIDFDAAKPGLTKLMKDKRALVTIKGEKPITVGELAEAVRDKFFHGVELAIKEKKANREKLFILDEIKSKRVFRKAALDMGIDKTDAYRSKLDEYKNSILFGTFIEKVVKPDVTITGKELKAYYDEHTAQYVFPQMLQIDAIVFKTRGDAQTAIDKLRQGMDFKWLKINADNQVDKNARGLLDFGGQMLTIKSFPETLQKVLSGAHAGDYRLYESPEGHFYALNIQKDVPSRTQTFEEVKDDVAQKVTWQNFSKAIEEWFKKLRDAYPVKIYLQEK